MQSAPPGLFFYLRQVQYYILGNIRQAKSYSKK
jgi:hypothetical protein